MRSSRPEIEELTRQTRVPVLVDGDEVVHDSKRIIQYLDWKYRREVQRESGRQADAKKEATKPERTQAADSAIGRPALRRER